MFKPGDICTFDRPSIQGILDALREAIVVVDDELKIVSMNHAAVDLFGDAAQELAERPVCRLFGEGSCPLDVLEETLRTGRPVVDYQTTAVLADGRPGEVELRTVPLAAALGARGGVALIVRDVTEVTRLRKDAAVRTGFAGMVGRDRRMAELYRLVEDVAPTTATVLIRGESGTGKELVARALHDRSGRADGPFVTVNCSALTETLLESELFGHVRGAFTGATADRRGRFEEANGGTIFLDEIGDVSPVVQVKLLRVLQERMVERVGDNEPLPVDVRVVTATNRDLEELVTRGRIREDFYYRIRVVALTLPPLRERRGDVPALVEHFLARHGRRPDEMTPDAMNLLAAHRWPGNVRELENAVEHGHVLSRGGAIGPEHLPPELRGGTGPVAAAASGVDERELIRRALVRNHWHRTRTARELGMDRSTLWRKIKTLEIEPDED